MKSKIVIALSLLIISIICVAAFYGTQLIGIGTAYKAKMLCSEIFVAGRQADNVLQDLRIDDLKPLEKIRADINYDDKSVTSSFYGLQEYKVVYNGQFGCSLENDESNRSVPHQFIDLTSEPTQLEFQKNMDASGVKSIVNEAFSEPNAEAKRRTRAVVVLHKGQILAEQYSDTNNARTPILGWSVTKSVMNAFVGVLVRKGHVTLDMSVLENAKNDGQKKITVNHLLNMTSGLDFNEEMTNPLADVTRMLLQEKDMAAFAANSPIQYEPGTNWYYSSGNTILLADFIRRVLGADEYNNFLQRELFDRIGMTHSLLETDASGTYVGSSFMYATARDWAKLGQLYLQDGVWEDKRVLPEGWVEYSITPAPDSNNNAYGAHFWLDIPEPYKSENDVALPAGTFHSIGHDGQFITIVPSHDLVIVRLGKTRFAGAWEHDSFVGRIISELQ